MDAAYLKVFEAQVVAAPPDGVTLSQTLFYPEGGGQEADHGTLSTPDGRKVDVVDVRRKSGAIVHRLERGGTARFQVGMHVTGELDWSRRYTNMRLHTAQHLLSALAFDRFGLKTTEASMHGMGGSIDLDGPLPDPSAAAALEKVANEQFFTRPVPVNIRMVSKEEFERMPGRSSGKPLPPSVTTVRLILIEGIDMCPCGGTHVRTTGEVGGVRLVPEREPQRSDARISFVLV